MQNSTEDSQELLRCTEHTQCNGTVLVSIGNALRQDDGIGQALIDNLVEEGSTDFCRFDLGTYSNYLLECLKGHDKAIVIDSTADTGNPGKVTVLNLNEVIRKRQALKLNSCHGFSLMDELQLARWQQDLPTKLLFFGVEANGCDWTEGLTSLLKERLNAITKQLQSVIASLTEVTNNA